LLSTIDKSPVPFKRSIVITGVSTGIGRTTAKLLLARGFRVFGSVRRQVDAERLQAEFGANFVPLLPRRRLDRIMAKQLGLRPK